MKIFSVLLFMAFVIGASRLAITSNKSEVGWETIRAQCQDATIGWLGQKHEPVNLREPTSQAQFWLAEVESRQPWNESAQLCIGAAWVLDSPGPEFEERYKKKSSDTLTWPPVTVDHAGIVVARADFEKQCRERGLFLVEQATSIERTDVRWWRSRALLLFNPTNGEPRDTAWLSILDECSRHDTNNALYDYLAAFRLWSCSAEYSWPNGWDKRMQVAVQDRDNFKLGSKLFASGLNKPFLAFGEDGKSAVAEFLDGSRVDKVVQAEIGLGRMSQRQVNLFRGLCMWLEAQSDHAHQFGSIDDQIRFKRETLRFNDQVIGADESFATVTLVLFDELRRKNYSSLDNLLKENPSFVSAAETSRLVDNERRLRIEAAVSTDTLRELDSKRIKPTRGKPSWYSILTTVSLTVASFAALLAICAISISRFSDTVSSNVKFGFIRHTAAWLIGNVVTFVVLGMAPADLISNKMQQTRTIFFLVTVSVVLVVIRKLYRRELRFSLRTLFGSTVGIAILVAAWPYIELAVFRFEDLRLNLAWGWNGIDAEVWRRNMGMENGTWSWATLQWFAHYGPYVALVTSLAILAIWFASRSAQQHSDGFLRYWTTDIKRRWSNLLRCLGTSAFILSVCWLTVYVWFVPCLIETVESEFQSKIQYCRNPQLYRAEIQDVRDRIALSDRMKIIQESVNAEFNTTSP